MVRDCWLVWLVLVVFVVQNFVLVHYQVECTQLAAVEADYNPWHLYWVDRDSLGLQDHLHLVDIDPVDILHTQAVLLDSLDNQDMVHLQHLHMVGMAVQEVLDKVLDYLTEK